MFSITQADAEAAIDVVEGILSICDKPSMVLFDLGSTHSYISPSVTSCIDVLHSDLPFVIAVTTMVGK